jgi:hypothetical protein
MLHNAPRLSNHFTVRQSSLVAPHQEEERDTILDHCSAPQQCVLDGIFAT